MSESDSSLPFVMCLMLTKDRQKMARFAVECFRRQTYPKDRRRLLIWEQSGDSDFEFEDMTDYETVFHVSAQVRSIGEARNDAIKFWTEFPIIVHWDDDDYSAPDRIEQQVKMLLNSGADVVGYISMVFWREAGKAQIGSTSPLNAGEAWEYRKRQRPEQYALGTSLCYWRGTWKCRPFRDTSAGEDLDFIRGRRIVSCDAGNVMVARIHAGNTSRAYDRKQMERSPEWRRVPERDEFCRSVFA